MTLNYDQAKAPHLGRSILIAPNRRINLAQTGHPLVAIAPKTRLGKVALDLAMASSTATIQIIATSAYVNSLTALSPPIINFTAPPPGTTIPVDSLQTAYEAFLSQLATLQGQAAAWISTSSGSGGASIFSSLVTTASTFGVINAQVQSDFTILAATTPNSPTWNNTLANLKTLIGVEAAPLTSLEGNITNLSTNLDTAATTLITAASTGVLSQLQAAYQSEIAALNQDISNCESQINSDNNKIIGLGFAAGGAIVVGVIGLVNIWNPIGWFMIAGGAVGAYFAISEILSLKGQIASLKAQIQNDTSLVNTDQTAAQSIAAFAQAAQNAADLNAAAQQELNTLLQLCNTLSSDIQTALTELNNQQFTEAQDEWNQIVAAAAFLEGITAYIWPSALLLADPTNLAAAGTNAWLVSNSGAVFGYATGGNTWTALPGSSLSVVAAGAIVAGIDGAPNDGSQLNPNSYGQTFFAKTYAPSTTSWTTISTFPVAQLATDGASIWAISQVTSDRQVYKYNGSGTSWTSVGSMPNADAPMAIVAASGTVAAIANNGGGLWANGGSGWQQVGTATYSSITANGGYVGLIDSANKGWVFNVASNTLAASMTGLSTVAQSPTGDQYVTDSSLNLWHVTIPQGGTPSSTQLRSNAVNVSISDTGQVYALDNTGAIWALTNLANNSWQQLPSLPPS